VLRLDSRIGDFNAQFSALVNARREVDVDVSRDVADIISRVRTEGDTAIGELTRKFDGHDLAWRIDLSECRAALEGLDTSLRAALELAANRIRDYHLTQRPKNSSWTDAAGVSLGSRWGAVDAAGVYVPGGRAAYPSSVLMNLIPAKVAGVERVVMVTPTPRGEANPLVLAAAALAGADEVWRIGGAQAIAALAYGTHTISRVDVVTGPGNAWVAEAKRQLYGVIGIDMIAGPSEILVVADGANNPDWIAADLLSQAEHDPTSQSILITDDGAFAEAVIRSVERQLPLLATEHTARASWQEHGAIILVENMESVPPLVDALAPEHLELAVEYPDQIFGQIKHAGSVFLGRYTPEAMGDYLAGPNHVLPTGRRARFSSGLSVLDFMKRTSFIGMTENSLRILGSSAAALADAEGLPAHAASIRERLK
jgi:histidinol dehydrogenase